MLFSEEGKNQCVFMYLIKMCYINLFAVFPMGKNKISKGMWKSVKKPSLAKNSRSCGLVYFLY